MWMALAIIIPAAVSIIGQLIASGDRARAEELRKKAAAEYNIPLPDLDSFTKELSTSTELQKVVADPKYSGAAEGALGKMGEYAMGSGMTPEDLATLDEAKQSASQYVAGREGARRQNVLARGIGGSGVDIAGQMATESQGADRAYHGGIQAAGAASGRRLAMLAQYGSFANMLKQQDLAQKNATASAQDNINRFNWQSRVGLKQQGFENAMGLASGKANAEGGLANYYTGSANTTGDVAGGIGQGIGRGVAAVGQAQQGAQPTSSTPAMGDYPADMVSAQYALGGTPNEGDDELGHYVLDENNRKIRSGRG